MRSGVLPLIALVLCARGALAQDSQPQVPPPPTPPPGYYPPPPGYYPPPPGYYPPPPGYYPPPPGYYPPPPQASQPPAQAAPEVAPEKQRGYHLHDGFLMRLAGGVGYVHLELETDFPLETKFAISGGGIGWQFDFGGSLADGLVLGGGYHGVLASDPNVEGASASSEASASLVMFGGFLSYFPDPKGGFELGGMLALALANPSTSDPFDGSGSTTTGLLGGPGMALWVGYAGWVSANWAIGGLARGSIGWMSGSATAQAGGAYYDADVRATARSLALCFGGTYQ